MVESAIAGSSLGKGTECIDNFAARAVIEREGQNHPGIRTGGFAGFGHFVLHRSRQFVLAADVPQTDVIFVERADFGFQIAAQQTHQEIDFRLGTLLPVLFGKSIKGQRRNSDASGGFNS